MYFCSVDLTDVIPSRQGKTEQSSGSGEALNNRHGDTVFLGGIAIFSVDFDVVIKFPTSLELHRNTDMFKLSIEVTF